MKENICTKLRFPSNWKKLGVTSLMVFLCISLFASEPIDFDKAFKASVKIEQQIKRTSFPGKVYNIKDFGATTDTPDQPCHEQINLAITTCNQEGRQFGIKKCPKKLVISLLFCNFIVDNQLITNIYSDDYH